MGEYGDDLNGEENSDGANSGVGGPSNISLSEVESFSVTLSLFGEKGQACGSSIYSGNAWVLEGKQSSGGSLMGPVCGSKSATTTLGFSGFRFVFLAWSDVADR